METRSREGRVGLVRAPEATYPLNAPFDPPQRFPELANVPGGTDPSNSVYAAVRTLFHTLGLDEERFGLVDWNPLGEFIRPDQTVVVKPNLVFHHHESGSDIFSAITHGSVIRAVLDYVYIALRGSGRVLIADSPLDNADFAEITKLCAIGEMIHVLARNHRMERRVPRR